jgi:NAD(P)-dependent dehydrogenase (short-subunit alcohol dehydrogenase family)
MGLRLSRARTGNRDLADLRSLDATMPFGHVCQPEDIAKVALFLCSDLAGYVTGQRIVVDGGGPLT